VVEDEALIALQVEEDIAAAGHEVAGCAMSAREALRLFEQTRPDVALVDIHLADGPTGVDVARKLAEAGCLVLFMTANVKRIPGDFAGALGVIAKPYMSGALQRGLRFIGAVLSGRNDARPPANMTLAPGRVRP